MNKRIAKIVEGLKAGKKSSVRRDQVKKAIEEKAFTYFIYRGYDEVYNVKPEKISATIENIESYWLNDGDFLRPQLLENGTKLVITIKHGYSYMELWADLTQEIEVVAEVEKIQESQEVVVENETNNSLDVEVKFNEEKNGIELYFNEKPSEEIRNQLKVNGYRWSNFNKCWYAKDSELAREFLKSINLLNTEEQQEDNTIEATEIKEVQKIEQPEIKINEDLAKRAKENMSFNDYKQGSATQEYNNVVDNMTQKINEAKEQIKDDSEKISQLDYLLTKFKKDYAKWINKKNANGASHVSVMISGASNYNMNKHNKYVAREDKLWQEYNDIMSIDSKIDKVIDSSKIIKSDDKNALNKLREKLEQEQKAHEEMKEYNKKARKENKEVYPAYMLSNSNQRIKNIKDRITQLEKLEELKETQGNTAIEINGIKIIDNLEANRVQMIFDGKPSEEIRKKLKSNGFRWSPSFGAWQRYRGVGATEKAKSIAELFQELNEAM
jgi:hypothetical protein